MKILNKVLWQNNNKWQIIGAVIGSFMGLLLLLLSIQFYMDLKELTQGDDQFVILNKEVTSFGANARFDEEEIQKISDEPFVKRIGRFSASNYRVSAGSAMLAFRTDLFFESVPDEYVDVEDKRFKWEKGQIEIPIILPKDYLALYNFGFATSQGLPQISSDNVEEINLDIVLQGNGIRKNYKGKIVGFSNRINSIIVPQSFMDFSNATFQEFKPKGTSRLIVLADNPYSDEFRKYLEENGYELSSGKLIGGKSAAVITSLITAVAIIGFLIVLLSVLIFVLNFQLMISKSSRDIKLMLQLGYKQNQIGEILKKHLLQVFGIVLLLTVVFFAILRYFILGFFATQGMNFGVVHFIVIGAGILFTVLFVIINYRNINRSIQNLSS